MYDPKETRKLRRYDLFPKCSHEILSSEESDRIDREINETMEQASDESERKKAQSWRDAANIIFY